MEIGNEGVEFDLRSLFHLQIENEGEIENGGGLEDLGNEDGNEDEIWDRAYEENASTTSYSEESEDEDVCQICFSVDPPGNCKRIYWDACDKCQLWFHKKCLDGE